MKNFIIGFLFSITILSLTVVNMYKKELKALSDNYNNYTYISDCAKDPVKTDKEDPFNRVCSKDGKIHSARDKYNIFQKGLQFLF